MAKILCFIPARGGSKGITNKNIRPFNGRPLLWYTVAEAKKSRYITRIVVSTESAKIAEVARRSGAEIPCLRPRSLSQDASKATDAVLHMLTYLKKTEEYVPDYIILLQATSPLRTTADIDGAFSTMQRRKADAIVSVCRTEQLLYIIDRRGRLQPVSPRAFLNSPNRQQLPPTYKLDGSMVYAIKTKVFLREKTFLAKNLVGYVIPRWRAVDLDEPEDFIVGETLYRNKKTIAKRIKDFK